MGGKYKAWWNKFHDGETDGKNDLRDLGTDVRLILKWALEKRVVKYVIWIKSTEYEMCFISLCSTGPEHLSL